MMVDTAMFATMESVMPMMAQVNHPYRFSNGFASENLNNSDDSPICRPAAR